MQQMLGTFAYAHNYPHRQAVQQGCQVTKCALCMMQSAPRAMHYRIRIVFHWQSHKCQTNNTPGNLQATKQAITHNSEALSMHWQKRVAFHWCDAICTALNEF
jgi:hypothetical protein